MTRQERLGQVLTPALLAETMATRLMRRRCTDAVSILDPCVGPCTFPEAIRRLGLFHEDDCLALFDLDEDLAAYAARWAPTPALSVTTNCADYLASWSEASYDYAIFNPPYIRQEWIDRKFEYIGRFEERYKVRVPGTSNLYVYFIVKAVNELKAGGSFACIVYDSWQSTRFGKWLTQYLNERCADLEFVPVPNQPFNRRLIDATIIYGTRRQYGLVVASGSANLCRTAGPCHRQLPGFAPLSELYEARRGLRLKQADFFLCGLSAVQSCGATPFVKKIAKVSGYAVGDNHPEAALLVEGEKDCPLVRAELRRRLRAAKDDPVNNVSILTWYRERPDIWMSHRKPPHAPLLFNNYMRHRPKHIYNPGRAYSDNFYGLTPRAQVPVFASLAMLNSTAACTEILSNARNQGNGLAKLQLFEYRNVLVPDLRSWSRTDLAKLGSLGMKLLRCGADAPRILADVDELISVVHSDPRLRPQEIRNKLSEAGALARRPKPALEHALA